MGLPEEVQSSEGIIAANGSVVYKELGNSISVTTQILETDQENAKLNAVRTLVTIKDATAPSSFKFKFDLPEGCRLVSDYDFHDEYDEYDCGAIFILDENDQIINTIEPAWAKDAAGNDVKTEYQITGNTLIQTVEFDEESNFPIVADPTSHPTKYSYYYLNKAQVKAVRDNYSSLGNMNNFYTGLLSLCSYYKAPLLGVGASVYFFNVVYQMVKYATWNKFYANFEKKYAEIIVAWNWRNGGQNSGYVLGKTTCYYVTQMEGHD